MKKCIGILTTFIAIAYPTISKSMGMGREITYKANKLMGESGIEPHASTMLILNAREIPEETRPGIQLLLNHIIQSASDKASLTPAFIRKNPHESARIIFEGATCSIDFAINLLVQNVRQNENLSSGSFYFSFERCK